MEAKLRYGSLLIFFCIAGSLPFLAMGADRIALSDNQFELNKFLFPPDSLNKSDTTTTLKTPFPLEKEKFPYTGEENSDPLFLKSHPELNQKLNMTR